MMWTPQQDAALLAVRDWLRDRDQQVFFLAGYAGTGKTTLARHLAEHIDGRVVFAAFTGKAALVLRQKGCEGARTIHSLLYRPQDGEAADGSPLFELNTDSDAIGAKLIIVDECSMVGPEIGFDLLGMGAKILVLGDPGQLPPVRGEGFFTGTRPDFLLTDVQRQARDNPIIALSMQVRDGRRLVPGCYGDSIVLPTGKKPGVSTVMSADQVLVGRNSTRVSTNRRFRELRGLSSPYPMVGDKLVCLRNDKRKGLLNGGLFEVEALTRNRGTKIGLSVVPDGDDQPISVAVRPEFFDGTEASLKASDRRSGDEFGYGYGLTVHKSQGSQWGSVVLIDESFAFRDQQARWLYTGITRAAQRVVVSS